MTHPSNNYQEEYALGYCPNYDNYDPSFAGPSWHDLMEDIIRNNNICDMYILFCGKTRSDGEIGGTGFGLVNSKSVQRVLINMRESEGGSLDEVASNPDNTAEMARELLALNVVPEHVTGIIVRAIRYCDQPFDEIEEEEEENKPEVKPLTERQRREIAKQLKSKKRKLR